MAQEVQDLVVSVLIPQRFLCLLSDELAEGALPVSCQASGRGPWCPQATQGPAEGAMTTFNR
jgi:hypothetical protein